MSFTREELQAMSRLSPSQRKAVYNEVYREASRAARVAASEGDGLQDAGMGKSLRKRIKKVVKKVTAPVKRVVDKVEDKVKRVIDKTEETVKRVASKIPGAKAVSDIGREIQEQAKRAGGAVQRIAKEAARKAAPLLAVAVPLSLSVKSIRERAGKFYKKHGAVIITVVGAVLSPFTLGISAAVAGIVVAGMKYVQASQAAKKAIKEGKKEAAQMEEAVRNQEADLHVQCDEIYNHPESHAHFLAIGITPEKWASMSVEVKMGIIDSLSKGEMPAGYSLTPEALADADEVRRKAQNDELDDLYVKYQAAFESYGYPPDQWYAMTVEQKYAAIDKLTGPSIDEPAPATPEETLAFLEKFYSSRPEAFANAGYPPGVWSSMTLEQKTAAAEKVFRAESSASSPSQEATTPPSQPSVPSTPSTPTYYPDTNIPLIEIPSTAYTGQQPQVSVPLQPLTTFSVSVEGDPVGVFGSLSEATEKALAASKPGDRVQIYQKGKGTTLGIRTAGGIVPVPEDQVAAVQAMSHGELVSKVSQATAAAGGAKTSGGFPWWLVAVPAVLFVGAKAKGA